MNRATQWESRRGCEWQNLHRMPVNRQCGKRTVITSPTRQPLVVLRKLNSVLPPQLQGLRARQPRCLLLQGQAHGRSAVRRQAARSLCLQNPMQALARRQYLLKPHLCVRWAIPGHVRESGQGHSLQAVAAGVLHGMLNQSLGNPPSLPITVYRKLPDVQRIIKLLCRQKADQRT